MLADFPHVTPLPRRSRLAEPSIVYKLYDVIKSSVISEYQPLTINLFQTNITEVDLHVDIDSRIPTSLKDLPSNDFEKNTKDNYITRQLKLICKDSGDTLEGDFFKSKVPKKIPVKSSQSNKEFNGIPLQLGAVTNLLNNQIFSGQTITENAFSLVKILQNFANAERVHKIRTVGHHQPPAQRTNNLTVDNHSSYFARGFFTQLNRNNIPTTIIARPCPNVLTVRRQVRNVPTVQELNNNVRHSISNPNPIQKRSQSKSGLTSYVNLGFMCR